MDFFFKHACRVTSTEMHLWPQSRLVEPKESIKEHVDCGVSGKGFCVELFMIKNWKRRPRRRGATEGSLRCKPNTFLRDCSCGNTSLGSMLHWVLDLSIRTIPWHVLCWWHCWILLCFWPCLSEQSSCGRSS